MRRQLWCVAASLVLCGVGCEGVAMCGEPGTEACAADSGGDGGNSLAIDAGDAPEPDAGMAVVDAGEIEEPCECFPDHAIGRCIEGECAIHGCLDGRLDCNGDVEDGCEVDPDTDVDHCRECGVECTVAANGSPVCDRGTCAADCDAGYLDCDGDPENGCERATVAYVDADGDGIGAAEHWILVCEIEEGVSSRGDDCDDDDEYVFPGQTACFSEPNERVGFDYDCDGREEPCLTDQGYCSSSCDGGQFGWTAGVPACGGSGLRVQSLSGCLCTSVTVAQLCN
jgi:hypothetical protein